MRGRKRGSRLSPKDVKLQFECNPLNLVVEPLLPGSPLRPLLTDVSAGGLVALMQVKVNPQRETPAKEGKPCQDRRGRDSTVSPGKKPKHLLVKQSAAIAGISGRSRVSEQEVDTLPLSMLTRTKSSVSWTK